MISISTGSKKQKQKGRPLGREQTALATLLADSESINHEYYELNPETNWNRYELKSHCSDSLKDKAGFNKSVEQRPLQKKYSFSGVKAKELNQARSKTPRSATLRRFLSFHLSNKNINVANLPKLSVPSQHTPEIKTHRQSDRNVKILNFQDLRQKVSELCLKRPSKFFQLSQKNREAREKHNEMLKKHRFLKTHRHDKPSNGNLQPGCFA